MNMKHKPKLIVSSTPRGRSEGLNRMLKEAVGDQVIDMSASQAELPAEVAAPFVDEAIMTMKSKPDTLSLPHVGSGLRVSPLDKMFKEAVGDRVIDMNVSQAELPAEFSAPTGLRGAARGQSASGVEDAEKANLAGLMEKGVALFSKALQNGKTGEARGIAWCLLELEVIDCPTYDGLVNRIA